ncbi:DENN/MADD domain containing 2Da isoform X1 [Tachysurus ichikawai]
MSRQSWGFSSLRLKSKRTSEDTNAFQRKGRLFSSLREDRRQKLSSVSEDSGAAEGGNQNISIERETELTKGKTTLPTIHLVREMCE